MGGIDVQQPEFFGAGRGFDNIIFVSDLTRSWGNHIDFPLLAERVAPFIAGRRVFCIGNSMGGFLAILASRYIEIEASISFAPQYSINPETAPWEDRWKKYTDHISEHKVSHVGDYFNHETSYYIFSGGLGRDRRHARLFPVRENISHTVFSDMKHNIAAYLKENGLLNSVVTSCLAGTCVDLKDIPHISLSPA